MDLINTTDEIRRLSNLLDKAGEELEPRAKEKARSEAHYDKMVATTMLELKNGRELEANGDTVKWTSVTDAKTIAKGLCEKERYEMVLADLRYKNLFTGIDILRSKLSGEKSILPHQVEH